MTLARPKEILQKCKTLVVLKILYKYYRKDLVLVNNWLGKKKSLINKEGNGGG